MTTDIQEATKEEVRIREPKKYKVILHNDDKTTFQFVIELLIYVFHKSKEDAFLLTNQVVGVYNKEVAEQKTEDSITIARQNGFTKFQVSCEPE